MRINFLQIGSGIMLAAHAIGASHLIQSTRAGFYFGFELLGVIILINLIKYPFLKHGLLYAQATGKSLFHAYDKLSRKFLIFYVITQTLTCIIGVAALTYITGGVAKTVFDGYTANITNFNINTWATVVITSCVAIVMLDNNRGYLQKIIRFLLISLLIATFLAFIVALYQYITSDTIVTTFTKTHSLGVSAFDLASLSFLLALMGSMPAPIDLAISCSVWNNDKRALYNNKTTNAQQQDEEEITEFKISYFIIIIAAILFLGLGAMILHNSGITLSTSGMVFTEQVLEIYTKTLGSWSWPFVSLCFLSVIFSTTLSAMYIIPRCLSVAFGILFPSYNTKLRTVQNIITINFTIFALIIIYFYVHSFTAALDFSHILTFLSAPIIGFINYKIINSAEIGKYRPSKLCNYWTLFGVGFFTVVTLIYFAHRINLL